MRIRADEGVEAQVVATLRKEGHEVVHIAELHPGVTDQEVLQFAEARVSLLLTTDKDFGEITYLQRQSKVGIVLARLHALSSEQKAYVIAALLHEHADELSSAFTVVTASSIRIRKRPGGAARDD